MSPEEIKQSLSKILLAEDKAAELLETFGSVKNMQVVVTSNLKMFVDELVDITALFFRPIIERNGGDLPNKKVKTGKNHEARWTSLIPPPKRN